MSTHLVNPRELLGPARRVCDLELLGIDFRKQSNYFVVFSQLNVDNRAIREPSPLCHLDEIFEGFEGEVFCEVERDCHLYHPQSL